MHKEKKKRVQSPSPESIRDSEDKQTTDYSQPQAVNGNTLYGHRAKWAVQILIERIVSIRYVKEWSEETGIPKSSLNRIILKAYGQTPGVILKEVKYEKVLREIEKEPNTLAYTIAVDSGFVSEGAQRRFLNENYDTNITALKLQIITGEPPVEWKWLTGE